MNPAYALIGGAAGVALWTGAVAWLAWLIARKLASADERADQAEAELARRDLADSQAEAAELRAIIKDLRERARELGYEGRAADEDAERRLRALSADDPRLALGVLLGGADEDPDGGPPGGAGDAAAPPGPTA